MRNFTGNNNLQTLANVVAAVAAVGVRGGLFPA
jgi:hypothetical protein